MSFIDFISPDSNFLEIQSDPIVLDFKKLEINVINQFPQVFRAMEVLNTLYNSKLNFYPRIEFDISENILDLNFFHLVVNECSFYRINITSCSILNSPRSFNFPDFSISKSTVHQIEFSYVYFLFDFVLKPLNISLTALTGVILKHIKEFANKINSTSLGKSTPIYPNRDSFSNEIDENLNFGIIENLYNFIVYLYSNPNMGSLSFISCTNRIEELIALVLIITEIRRCDPSTSSNNTIVCLKKDASITDDEFVNLELIVGINKITHNPFDIEISFS